MEREKALEFIRKGEAFAADPACREVMRYFGEFIDLYYQKDEYSGDLNYLNKLQSSYQHFWSALRKASGGAGLSDAGLREYLGNPDNFTPEQWKNLQDLKQRMKQTRRVVGSAHRRLKKNANTMRI